MGTAILAQEEPLAEQSGNETPQGLSQVAGTKHRKGCGGWPVRWHSTVVRVRRDEPDRRSGWPNTRRDGTGCAPRMGGGVWTRTPTSRSSAWTCAACRR